MRNLETNSTNNQEQKEEETPIVRSSSIPEQKRGQRIFFPNFFVQLFLIGTTFPKNGIFLGKVVQLEKKWCAPTTFPQNVHF
jgi:hypothetical protein